MSDASDNRIAVIDYNSVTIQSEPKSTWGRKASSGFIFDFVDDKILISTFRPSCMTKEADTGFPTASNTISEDDGSSKAFTPAFSTGST